MKRSFSKKCRRCNQKADTAPAKTSRERLQQIKAASDRISIDSQPLNQAKERRRLTQEQEVIREGVNSGDCAPVLCQRWPNYGAWRQTLADKFAGLRQNQVRLS